MFTIYLPSNEKLRLALKKSLISLFTEEQGAIIINILITHLNRNECLLQAKRHKGSLCMQLQWCC